MLFTDKSPSIPVGLSGQVSPATCVCMSVRGSSQASMGLVCLEMRDTGDSHIPFAFVHVLCEVAILRSKTFHAEQKMVGSLCLPTCLDEQRVTLVREV